MATQAEIGSSGLRRAGGYVSADFLPQLNGYTGAKTYTEMSVNDPVISSILFAMKTLLRQTQWRVEAADVKDTKAVELATRVSDALFYDMERGWGEVVASISTMFTYGYSPLEIIWQKDKDWIRPIRLALRHPESLDRWDFNEKTGAVMGMWQQDPSRPASVYIPIEKLLLFRTDTGMNNPEGQSLLRGSYVPWMRKRALEEAEGRSALRGAGLVMVRVPGEIIAGTDARSVALYSSYKTLAEALAQDRQGAVVLPSDLDPETKGVRYDVEYIVADGRRSQDMTAIIDRLDKRIASTVLADFIFLGQQAVGSFALSSDKTALFAAAVGSFNQMIGDVFNRELLPRWWALNGYDEEQMPSLKPSDVETPNLQELGSYLGALSAAGAPLFPDKDLEDYLRTAGGMPVASDEVRAEQLAAQQEQQLMAQQAHEAQLATGAAVAEATVSGAKVGEGKLALDHKKLQHQAKLETVKVKETQRSKLQLALAAMKLKAKAKPKP
jgi:hypothetical protein